MSCEIFGSSNATESVVCC